jgi:hypothetical protein
LPQDRYQAPWLTIWPYILAIILSAAGLFGYWFAIADRYRVFLYFHDMGRLVPDTTPFSRVTASRYWMSALVWAGALMILYAGANWLAGRLSSSYQPPAWWQLWLISFAPISFIIVLITMTTNQPVLPAEHTARVVLVALVGLALALAPGRTAATRPVSLLLLAGDGLALMLFLTATLGIERLGQFSASNRAYTIAIAFAGVASGLAVLAILSAMRLWQRWLMPRRGELLVAALCVAYLLLPLVHHLGFTDGIFYISDADNFFARNLAGQLGIWLALLLLVSLTTGLRERWQARWQKQVADSSDDPLERDS